MSLANCTIALGVHWPPRPGDPTKTVAGPEPPRAGGRGLVLPVGQKSGPLSALSAELTGQKSGAAVSRECHVRVGVGSISLYALCSQSSARTGREVLEAELTPAWGRVTRISCAKGTKMSKMKTSEHDGAAEPTRPVGWLAERAACAPVGKALSPPGRGLRGGPAVSFLGLEGESRAQRASKHHNIVSLI